MTSDVPNDSIQNNMPKAKGYEVGVLVDLLVEMSLEVYGTYVVYENGCKVLYVQVFKDPYGMMLASLLCCKKMSHIKNNGFSLSLTTSLLQTYK